MTSEVVRIAEATPVPVDSLLGRCRAYCAHEPDGYHVYFGLDGGRRHSAYVGPAFPKPQGATLLAHLINGDPTPRSAPVIPAAPSSQDPRGEPDLEPSEAPETASSVGRAPDRTCVVCGGPIPLGSRSHRLTCSPACRVARSRGVGRDIDGGTPAVTLSGSSGEPDRVPDSPPSRGLGQRSDQLALELAPPH